MSKSPSRPRPWVVLPLTWKDATYIDGVAHSSEAKTPLGWLEVIRLGTLNGMQYRWMHSLNNSNKDVLENGGIVDSMQQAKDEAFSFYSERIAELIASSESSERIDFLQNFVGKVVYIRLRSGEIDSGICMAINRTHVRLMSRSLMAAVFTSYDSIWEPNEDETLVLGKNFS